MHLAPATRVMCAATALLMPILLGACQGGGHRHSMEQMTAFNLAQLWEPADPEHFEEPYALDLTAMNKLDAVMQQVQKRRLVFVGETHDRFDHHVNQLAVIKRMHATNPRLAIGMEMFQQPFQQALDDYVAGKIDEQSFLRQSQYYERWRVDYRNYRPIIEFARANHLALVALDITDELRHKIGEQGVQGLSPAEREQIPAEIDRSNNDYRELMQAIFQLHPPVHDQNFEKFLEVQLIRDEAMAQTTANYLQKHADTNMVVLAGGGHLVYGYGIPQRVQRRLKVDAAILLNDITHEPRPELADYILLPRPASLPPAGRLGVVLDTQQAGVVRVSSLADDSPARGAGIAKNDVILAINDTRTASMTDIKFSLQEKKPGDAVTVHLSRRDWLGKVKELAVPVTLY